MSNQDSTRRSTAVQFFLEDEAEEASSSYNQVVEWLNKAAVNGDPTAKTDLLRKVQEIIINKEESLLDNFLDEVLNFQTDRNSDVRKFVVGFIEEACKRDPEVIPKVVVNLSMLLQDASAQVQKKVVQVSAQVYQTALGWLSRAKAVTDNMEAAWGVVSNIKAQIVNLIDSDNDGIRTHAVKFLERVVLLQTYPEPDSMQRDNDFTLEDVPMTLKIARRRKLEEEALMVFELLLNFHGSQHISSINLMTCMGSLTLIAKMRPSIFMGKVVTAFEKLHINLPPTLSKSQVSSVRKHLKIQLLNLLKHPSAVDYHTNITTLLTDLGATHQEIVRSFPRLEELRRRQKRIANAPGPGPHMAALSKKPRPEVEEEEDASDEDEGELKLKRKFAPGLDSAIDVTEQFVFERLTPDVTTQLVMLSMIKLPDSMPAHFSATYTPIAAAGTPHQIRHVARLMAAQLTTLGLGPGARQVKKMKMMEEEDDEDVSQHSKASISSAISGIIDKDKDSRVVVAKTSLLPSGGIAKVAKQRIKTLKLSEITRPLDEESQSNMMKAAVMRILKAERDAAMGGILTVRNKVLTILAATFKKDVRQVILEFLLEDLRNRIDLGFAWLYEEYSFMQGFNRLPPFLKQETSPDHSYNHLLCSLAKSLIEKISYDGKDGSLLMRLYLEAPMITDEAVDILKAMCCEETKAAVGLTLLQELVLRRPPRQLIFLNSLLVHTAHENNEVRTRAISSVVTLYNRGDLRSIVEEYAVLYLSFLRLPHPPDVLFGAERGRTKPEPMDPDEEMAGVIWTEEAVRACLYLYLALLPLNEKLIHELAKVYVQTVADVKRTILRLLEQPVRGMGMDSPQLLKLVEECPKGSETLVTRLIHILTDKTPPSTELVARVRDLYHTRVSDVRFLIPVLNGLTKKEVIAALPRLIKLNPVVVKEVFNRLLGTHSESVSHTSPLTPAELLIALHLIDPSKCELKTVIKATSLCFSEKQAYSQEVLAVVLQHLMDVVPLPTLLMRTVIQSLSLYPRLIGFVMNILQRLILKQVWKQKKVWEGFIKCCQRTKPQSFQVLLQLPPAQLSDVFESSPDLRQPLLAHVMAFTENQRAHIPQSIMDVLLGKKRTSEEDLDESMDAQSPSELTIDIKEELDDVARIEPAPPGLD